MLRSAASKVMWVGKGTVFLVGLAVIVALVLGVATTALAAIPGDPFKLGRINTIEAVSTLAGNVAGPMLRVDNNSTGAGATALDLQVEAGKAPMKVNSAAKVVKLNADRLDGVDSTGFYAAGSKVADSSHADQADSATNAQNASNSQLLDGRDSSEFLGANQKASDSELLDGKDSRALGVTTLSEHEGTVNCARNVDGVNYCATVAVKVPAGKQYHLVVFSSFTAESASTTTLRYCPRVKGSSFEACLDTTNEIDLAGGYAESGANSGDITLGPGTYNVSTFISPRAELSYGPYHTANTTVLVTDATAPGPPIN